MKLFGFIGNKKNTIAVNDALLKMEQMAAQFAAVAGNTVSTDICKSRIEELKKENIKLKKGLA